MALTGLEAERTVSKISCSQKMQVVTITLVDDLLSEYGGRSARHVLTKPSDLLFFAGPCTGGSSWARLNKTRGIDTEEKIEAKQREFWRFR